MPDDQFNEDRAVYDSPTYTLGQLLDQPETIPADIRDQLMAGLQKLLDDGIKSGVAEEFDFDTFIARKCAEHGLAK